jgi:hypothetical protein
MLSYIKLPYSVIKFKSHLELKQALLDSLDNSPADSIISHDHTISRTDWNIENREPEYIDIIKNDLLTDFKEIFSLFGFKKFCIHDFWFQQYQYQDSHYWHNHPECHYTAIYYLEFPFNSPNTQFIDPINNQQIFEVSVNEGDILIIPSMLKHRSPPLIKKESRKTILSFNISLIEDNEN